jgi:transcription elongation factor
MDFEVKDYWVRSKKNWQGIRLYINKGDYLHVIKEKKEDNGKISVVCEIKKEIEGIWITENIYWYENSIEFL